MNNSKFLIYPIVWVCLSACSLHAESSKLYFSTPQQLTMAAFANQMAIGPNGSLNYVAAGEVCETAPPGLCSIQVVFGNSMDGGTTFSTPKQLLVGSDVFIVTGVSIAVDSHNHVLIAYSYEIGGGNSTVYFVRSLDGGSTFSSPQPITPVTADASQPIVLTDDKDHVYLAWNDNLDVDPTTANASFIRSIDGGSTFSEPINACTAPVTCTGVTIAMSKNRDIYAAWAQGLSGNNVDVYFTHSSTFGADFATPRNLSNTPDALSSLPKLGIDQSGDVYATWSKANVVSDPTSTANSDVYLVHSSNRGVSFSAAKRLSDGMVRSVSPQLAFGQFNGDVNVSWLDQTNAEVLFTRSTDGGNKFSDPKSILTDVASGTSMTPGKNGEIDLAYVTKTPLGLTSQLYFSQVPNGSSKATIPTLISGTLAGAFLPVAYPENTGAINIIFPVQNGAGGTLYYVRGVSIDSLTQDVLQLPNRAFNRYRRDDILAELFVAGLSLDLGNRRFAATILEDLANDLNSCITSPHNTYWIADCSAKAKIQNEVSIILTGISH